MKLKLTRQKKTEYKQKINKQKPKTAVFLTVKHKETSALVYFTAGALGGIIGIAIVATAQTLMYKHLLPSKEMIKELDYDTGRLLYQLHEEIKLITIN